MKAPSLAPAYACLLPQLAEVARGLGYALAIHGTMTRDLDLLACPWVDDPAPPKILALAIWEQVRWLNCDPETVIRDPTLKPHGRLAWTIPLRAPAYLDLSVFPPHGASRPLERIPTMASEIPAIPRTIADEIGSLALSVANHAALTRATVVEKLGRVSFPPVLSETLKDVPVEDYPPYYEALRIQLKAIDEELNNIEGAIARAQV